MKKSSSIMLGLYLMLGSEALIASCQNAAIFLQRYCSGDSYRMTLFQIEQCVTAYETINQCAYSYQQNIPPHWQSNPPAYSSPYSSSANDQILREQRKMQCERNCSTFGNAYADGGIERIQQCKAEC